MFRYTCTYMLNFEVHIHKDMFCEIFLRVQTFASYLSKLLYEILNIFNQNSYQIYYYEIVPEKCLYIFNTSVFFKYFVCY